jgi:hypothetical protein
MEQIWNEWIGRDRALAWWDEATGTLRVEIKVAGKSLPAAYGSVLSRESAIREVIALIDVALKDAEAANGTA